MNEMTVYNAFSSLVMDKVQQDENRSSFSNRNFVFRKGNKTKVKRLSFHIVHPSYCAPLVGK